MNGLKLFIMFIAAKIKAAAFETKKLKNLDGYSKSHLLSGL